MENNRITNAEELRREIMRLEQISSIQKAELKKELYNFKENFRPGNILKSLITDLTGIRFEKNSFLKDGFSYTVSMLIQNFFLRQKKNSKEVSMVLLILLLIK